MARTGLYVDGCRIMWVLIQHKGSLKHLFQNFSPPPLTVKTAYFTTHCHFVSSWKSIYWKRWSTLDGTIRNVRRLLQNYVRNSNKDSLNSLIYFRIPPPLTVKAANFTTHGHFVSWFKKKEREGDDQVSHTATACLFLPCYHFYNNSLSCMSVRVETKWNHKWSSLESIKSNFQILFLTVGKIFYYFCVTLYNVFELYMHHKKH